MNSTRLNLFFSASSLFPSRVIIALVVGMIWLVGFGATVAGAQTGGQDGPTGGQDDPMRRINPRMPRPMEIDEARVEASGVRRLEGKFVTLYTDVRDDPMIDELPLIFDAAISQWCAYFEIPAERTDDWRVAGFVMQDKERFRNAGLIPADLPEFPAGFNRGHEMWIVVHPGSYYTRHLLLHEGTHAFMQWFLGGTGAPWYSEGMAELMAVHSWENGELNLQHRLRDAADANGWGRPKVIREAREAGELPSLGDVLATGPIGFREVENYAWAWAACRFLGGHPLSRAAFANMRTRCNTSSAEFNVRLEQAIADHREALDRDWQLYLAEQDYGYEIGRGLLRDAAAGPADAQPATKTFRIATDHGWQLTDLHVETGQQFRITADGQFRVARTVADADASADPTVSNPLQNETGNNEAGNNEAGNNGGENMSSEGTTNEVAWMCEAGGVTIDYYRERPLGMLVAGVLGDDDSVDDFQQGNAIGHAIGLDSVFTASKSGRLCFRINESPARMDDNEGHLNVKAQPLEASPGK